MLYPSTTTNRLSRYAPDIESPPRAQPRANWSNVRIQTYQPYKSITETPTNDELPGFTLITGANGAGKTHLLESMREYKTQIDGGYGGRRARMLGTADLQAVDHLGAMPLTDCMGVSAQWPGPGSANRLTLSENRARTEGWYAPDKCWTSFAYGQDPVNWPPTANCSS